MAKTKKKNKKPAARKRKRKPASAKKPRTTKAGPRARRPRGRSPVKLAVVAHREVPPPRRGRPPSVYGWLYEALDRLKPGKALKDAI